MKEESVLPKKLIESKDRDSGKKDSGSKDKYRNRVALMNEQIYKEDEEKD